MILTADEYRTMGFYTENETLLENCLKRAEYVLNGITGGQAGIVAAKGGKAADFVKQAAAFQTRALISAESANAEASEGSESSENTEKITVGDFSYSTSSGSTKSSSESTGVVTEAFDTGSVVIHLLRSAGCLFGGMEARE